MTSTHLQDSAAASAADQPFRSNLQEGPQRFLAYAIEHSLKHGRRTPKDFIRHFPPETIMKGLEDEPQLRANILVAATGIRKNIALKKSAKSCGSDLQIALDEQETHPETVVGLFAPDDRVRFLDNRALWNFLIEGEFWHAEPKKDPKAHAAAALHISYLIERALEDQLLSHRDVVKGITVQSMTSLLPRSELPKIIEAALELGQANKPFIERNLLGAIGISTLTAHVPLASIWTQVVVPYIADPHGLSRKAEVVEPPEMEERATGRLTVNALSGSPSATSAQSTQAKSAQFAVQRPAPGAPPPPKAAPPPDDDAGMDLEVEEVLGALNATKTPSKKIERRTDSTPPPA